MGTSPNREQLIAYILDELEPSERKKVEDCLQRSAEYRAEMEEISMVLSRLTEDATRDNLEMSDTSFVVEVDQKIDDLQNESSGWDFLPWLTSFGLCLVVFFIFVSLQQMNPRQTTDLSRKKDTSSNKSHNLVKKSKSFYPDFSGLSTERLRLASKAYRISSSPMPAFPAKPRINKSLTFKIPKKNL